MDSILSLTEVHCAVVNMAVHPGFIGLHCLALWCEAGILYTLPTALPWHQCVLEALGAEGGTKDLSTLYFWFLIAHREAGACLAGNIPWEVCTNPIEGVIVCAHHGSADGAGAAAALLVDADQLVPWLTLGQTLGAGGCIADTDCLGAAWIVSLGPGHSHKASFCALWELLALTLHWLTLY